MQGMERVAKDRPAALDHLQNFSDKNEVQQKLCIRIWMAQIGQGDGSAPLVGNSFCDLDIWHWLDINIKEGRRNTAKLGVMWQATPNRHDAGNAFEVVDAAKIIIVANGDTFHVRVVFCPF